MKHRLAGMLEPSGELAWHPRHVAVDPLACLEGTTGMASDTTREAQIFTMVVGCVMVGLILYGVLGLMGVVHT